MELHGVQIAVEVLLAGDLPVLLDLRVALDDVEVDLGEEVLLLAQDVVGLGDESLHQVATDGAGGVDGDDELLDPPDLLVLQRLHQGHIAVQGQAVGVVDIVELVLVHLGDLAQAHIAAEEVRVVVRLPVHRLQLLDQGAGVGAVAAGDGLQVHLEPLADLPPGLLQILVPPLGAGLGRLGPAAAAAPAGLLLAGGAGLRRPAGGLTAASGALSAFDGQVPRPVVIRQEGLPHPGHLIVGEVLVQKIPVQLLRRQGADLGAQLLQSLLLGHRPGTGGALQVEARNGVLHRDVAGQVPAPPADVGAGEQVAEHAVEHDVQIVPHVPPSLPLVHGEDIVGVVKQVLAVRGQGAGVGGQLELAEGQIQKPQVHQKGVPGQPQNVLGQGVRLAKFFHMIFHHLVQLFPKGAGRPMF